MDKKLKDLKQNYENVPIPAELDRIVERALKRPTKRKRTSHWFLALVAAAALVFTISVNTSTTFAKNLAQIPILSSIVDVLTFATIEDHDGKHQATIEIPKITGDSEDIAALNAQYEKEGREIYEQYLQFSADMDDEGYYGVDSGYLVLTDNEQLLSFARYVVEIVGSSSTVMTYTTIDKHEQIAITLPSLFKDDRYIETISTYIADDMRRQMQEDENVTYWVATEDSEEIGNFETIQKEHNFYITAQGKLVIAFDKYEVAPGVMGVVEFEIPTTLIQGLLVSNRYIH